MIFRTRAGLAVALWLVTTLATALTPAMAADPPRTTPGPAVPTGKGLPVLVKAGVAFLSLDSFSENSGTFKATVDLRLRWADIALRRPAIEANDPPRVLRGAAALAKLEELWVPRVDVINQRGEASYTETGLRIFPDGTVEMMRRIAGEFATPVDIGRFPFDRQELRIELAVRDQTADTVALEYEQGDLDFSRPSRNASLDGWEVGTVELFSQNLPGWYGATHSSIVASLDIARVPGPVIASIFIPLFASLLIPLLGIWLNTIEDGVFQLETFEFVNLIVGGLFAVIALNFTVNSTYQLLGTNDNPVSRLFALNFVALGMALLINVALFRYNVVARYFGRYVQEQLYLYLIWAVPVLMLVAATSVILSAMA
jgi:hypothetical protein